MGEAGERDADVRLIAATNRDLAAEVRRAASAKTSTTASTWCRCACRRCASGAKTSRSSSSTSPPAPDAATACRAALPPAVLQRLLDHTWPGNVRELGNAVERLVLLAEDGQVSADDLPGA